MNGVTEKDVVERLKKLETCEERDHGEEWNRRADPSETLREALTNLVLAVEAGRPDAITKALSKVRASHRCHRLVAAG